MKTTTTPKKPSKQIPTSTIYILPAAKTKLDLYVELAEGEISGLGIVKKFRRNDFLIEDILLFKQKCTPEETLLERSDVADYILKMILAGDDPSHIKLWWHSHADMSTFWSVGTDEVTIHGFNNDWMISVVTNFAGDYLCRLDAYQPVHMSLLDIPLRVLLPASAEIRTEAMAEVADKVTFSIPQVPPLAQHNYFYPIKPVRKDIK